jgi:predicted metal-dependent phosphotriesterase family hydrolase
VRLLVHMTSAGHTNQLMLGTDGARRSMWTSLGGSPGLAALSTQLVPLLADQGVDDAAIDQMMVHNPAQFLAFVGNDS